MLLKTVPGKAVSASKVQAVAKACFHARGEYKRAVSRLGAVHKGAGPLPPGGRLRHRRRLSEEQGAAQGQGSVLLRGGQGHR